MLASYKRSRLIWVESLLLVLLPQSLASIEIYQWQWSGPCATTVLEDIKQACHLFGRSFNVTGDTSKGSNSTIFFAACLFNWCKLLKKRNSSFRSRFFFSFWSRPHYERATLSRQANRVTRYITMVMCPYTWTFGNSRARAYCACSRWGCGVVWTFLLSSIFSPLSGRRPDKDCNTVSKGR